MINYFKNENAEDRRDGPPNPELQEGEKGIAFSWVWKKQGIRRFIGPKRMVILIGLILLILLAIYLRQNGWLNPDLLQRYIRIYPFMSALLFVAIYVVSIMSSFPTLPLNLAAGFFWGGFGGGLIATIAGGIGAILSFLGARVAFGQPLAKKFDPSRLVIQLQDEFDQKGWRFIAFVRLNPIFPTGVLNYVFGLTSINFWTYTWASIVFLFPPSLLFGIIGNRAGTFLLNDQINHLMSTILIISLSITLLISLRFISRFLTQKKEGP